MDNLRMIKNFYLYGIKRSIINVKNLIIFICGLVCSEYFFGGIRAYARVNQIRINPLELFPYTLSTIRLFIFLFAIYYIIIYYFPVIDESTRYYLVRSNWKCWYIGQCLCVLTMGIIFFLGLLLCVSLPYVTVWSFQNEWSGIFRQDNISSLGIKIGITCSDAIRSQGSPLYLCIISFLLIIGLCFFFGVIQLNARLSGGRKNVFLVFMFFLLLAWYLGENSGYLRVEGLRWLNYVSPVTLAQIYFTDCRYQIGYPKLSYCFSFFVIMSAVLIIWGIRKIERSDIRYEE